MGKMGSYLHNMSMMIQHGIIEQDDEVKLNDETREELAKRSKGFAKTFNEATLLFDFALVEKAEGPHKGETWRTEKMTEAEAKRRNKTIEVMKWEKKA